MKDVLKVVGLGSLGIVGFILLVALLFVVGVAITSGIIALGWNVCGAHTIFGAPALTFWQVVGISALINLLWGVFRGHTVEA